MADGARVEGGARLWTVRGRARGHPDGRARRAQPRAADVRRGDAGARRTSTPCPPGAATRITDTRKTTPGLRALERYAVRAGGAHNHRDDLGAAVLIKDDHIAACGGVRPAIERARAAAPHTAKIECEVDSLEQLDEALAAGADIVLLDNMPTATLAEAVKRARGRALLEASGGITLARIAELARAGRRRHQRRRADPLGAGGGRRARLRVRRRLTRLRPGFAAPHAGFTASRADFMAPGADFMAPHPPGCLPLHVHPTPGPPPRKPAVPSTRSIGAGGA